MPQDDAGWTAFDYGRAILHELQILNEDDAGDDDSGTLVRMLSQQGAADYDGGNNSYVSFRVPPGVNWKVLGYTAYTGVDAAFGLVLLYRNVEAPSALVDVAQIAGVDLPYVSKSPGAPLTHGENTVLLFRVHAQAAVAAAVRPTVNLFVEQTPIGGPPQETEGGGEFGG